MKKQSTFKIEREHKFLVENVDISQIKPLSVQNIIQGYINEPGSVSDVRIRSINGNEYYMTMKTGSGFERCESETKLTERQFLKQWPKVNGGIVEKTRYRLLLKKGNTNIIGELDVYGGKLHGLIVLEIELEENETLEGVILPEWVRKDVTGDIKYSNRYLARQGLSK